MNKLELVKNINLNILLIDVWVFQKIHKKGPLSRSLVTTLLIAALILNSKLILTTVSSQRSYKEIINRLTMKTGTFTGARNIWYRRRSTVSGCSQIKELTTSEISIKSVERICFQRTSNDIEKHYRRREKTKKQPLTPSYL